MTGRDIKVAIYDDMLEITSPGDVMPSINLEHPADNPSEIRNRILAPIFKECGLIEQWGTGFKKIIREMEDYPELELRINEPGLSVQIQFIKKSAPGTPQVPSRYHSSGIQVLEVKDSHIPYAEQIIEFCKTERSREEIQKHIKINNRKYFRESILNPLLNLKVLRMTVPDKPSSSKQKYIISMKNKEE